MQQPGSITFGTPIASAASSAPPAFGSTPGFSFGSNTANTASTPGFSFGSPAANTGLKFGATPAPTANLFATPTTTSTGLNFGGTTQASGFALGTSASTAPASTGLTGFGSTASTPASTNLNFGFKTSTPATISLGLNLGTSAPTTALATSTVPTLNFGLGGQSISSTSAGPSFGLFAKPSTATVTAPVTVTTSSQVPSIGLGGVDTSQNKLGAAGANGNDADKKAVKENQIPNELAQLIDGFKNHVKQQKMFSSDVARCSIKPLRKIQEDIEGLRTMLTELINGLTANRQQADKLKFDTAKTISHAEMAQRTYDTPPGFQFDNTAPLQFFIETVSHFEVEMNTIRQQIEETEKHIRSLEKPRNLSSQELALGMRRLHETFIALAGRLQSVHNQVDSQKEQYLNLRKFILKDSSNVFEEKSKVGDPSFQSHLASTIASVGSKISVGPTPFSTLGNSPFGFMSMPQQSTQTTTAPTFSGPTTGTLSWGTPNQPNKSFSLSFDQTSVQYGGQSGSDNFQLQKPPLGNKRGKH